MQTEAVLQKYLSNEIYLMFVLWYRSFRQTITGSNAELKSARVLSDTKNHLLTADFRALVRPVLAVWLPITVPPLRNTLAVVTHKVQLCTSLFNWSGRQEGCIRYTRKSRERLFWCSLMKHLTFKKKKRKTKAIQQLMDMKCGTHR